MKREIDIFAPPGLVRRKKPTLSDMDRLPSKTILVFLTTVVLAALLSGSCADGGRKGTNENPELWKELTGSDWASWGSVTGCEMKFIGRNTAIIMEWAQDTVTKTWKRTVSNVGEVEFLEDNWFLIRYDHNFMACMFDMSAYTYENSAGAVFRKSQINAFRARNK